MHAPPIQRLLRNLQATPFHHQHYPRLWMLHNKALFPLTHDSDSATPTRIGHFFSPFWLNWIFV